MLLSFVVYMTLLASFFVPLSLINICMTLIIMWYQKVCNCRQYCFDLVRSHQCSTAYTPLVPRVYIHEITQSSCGFLSMRFITCTCTCTCTSICIQYHFFSNTAHNNSVEKTRCTCTGMYVYVNVDVYTCTYTL